jgi:hypothetical protein
MRKTTIILTAWVILSWGMFSCASQWKTQPVYNLVLVSKDRGEIPPGEDNSIYYRIYLNKEYTQKTPSGLFFQEKRTEMILSPGKYLVFPERWELRSGNDGLPEFQKSNNRLQEREGFYVTIPEKGIVTVTFGFDHKSKSTYSAITLSEK